MSNPWDRQRKDGQLEPQRWFSRFTLYRNMGAERTLLGAVNKVANKGKKRQTSIPGSWSRMSKYWDWDKRAEAWDAFELERKEALFRKQCDEWTAKRFEIAIQARDKAEAFLAFPVSKRTTVGDDGKTYIIEPLSTKALRDAVAAFKVADELARITTRETLPVQKIAPTDPTGEKSYQPLNLENLTDADLERLGSIIAKTES